MWLIGTITFLQLCLSCVLVSGADWGSCQKRTSKNQLICSLKEHIDEVVTDATNKILDALHSQFSKELEDQAYMLKRIGMLTQGEATVRFKHCPTNYDGESGVSGSRYRDGYYRIYPVSCAQDVEVHCSSGSMKIFERSFDRDDGVSLNKPWVNYKNGFSESFFFWIGLENLHHLTKNGDYMLKVEGGTYGRSLSSGIWSHFMVHEEETGYQLEVGDYNRDSTLSDFLSPISGAKFSTFDRDNDELQSINCAGQRMGGWWFTDCGIISVTGPKSHTLYRDPSSWPRWSDPGSTTEQVIRMYITPRWNLPQSRNCYGPGAAVDGFDLLDYY